MSGGVKVSSLSTLKLYRKTYENGTPKNNYRSYSKTETVWFYNAVMRPEDADGMAKSVVPDQTAP